MAGGADPASWPPGPLSSMHWGSGLSAVTRPDVSTVLPHFLGLGWGSCLGQRSRALSRSKVWAEEAGDGGTPGPPLLKERGARAPSQSLHYHPSFSEGRGLGSAPGILQVPATPRGGGWGCPPNPAV